MVLVNHRIGFKKAERTNDQGRFSMLRRQLHQKFFVRMI